MADKKNTDNSKDSTASTTSELDTLRQIVFGAAQSDIEQRIHTLEAQTQNRFAKLEQSLAKNTQVMQATIDDGFHHLEEKLAKADHVHDEKEAEINAYADRISSALEMAEANNKQENDGLHERLDKEIKNLSATFTEQLNQAFAKLNQVSTELNSSKTDRKTLAKLLAAVASDLETGGDE